MGSSTRYSPRTPSIAVGAITFQTPERRDGSNQATVMVKRRGRRRSGERQQRGAGGVERRGKKEHL